MRWRHSARINRVCTFRLIKLMKGKNGLYRFVFPFCVPFLFQFFFLLDKLHSRIESQIACIFFLHFSFIFKSVVFGGDWLFLLRISFHFCLPFLLCVCVRVIFSCFCRTTHQMDILTSVERAERARVDVCLWVCQYALANVFGYSFGIAGCVLNGKKLNSAHSHWINNTHPSGNKIVKFMFGHYRRWQRQRCRWQRSRHEKGFWDIFQKQFSLVVSLGVSLSVAVGMCFSARFSLFAFFCWLYYFLSHSCEPC